MKPVFKEPLRFAGQKFSFYEVTFLLLARLGRF
jgi:hypothetical protein